MFHLPSFANPGGSGRMSGVFALSSAESDAALSQRAAETWTCVHCGYIVRHPIPAELRFQACYHAREHEAQS